MNRLEARAAERLGKEAALFVPSGTMANQASLHALTRPGDVVLAARGLPHPALRVGRRRRRSPGVQIQALGGGGRFGAEDVRGALSPPDAALRAGPRRRDREHPQRRRRDASSRSRSSRRIAALARERGPAAPPRRRAALQRGGRERDPGRRLGGALRHRVVLPLEGPRRAGRLAGRRQPRRSARRCTACARCSAAACARPASSPPRGSTRSSTTWSGCATTTPTRRASRRASRPSGCGWRGSPRPTS